MKLMKRLRFAPRRWTFSRDDQPTFVYENAHIRLGVPTSTIETHRIRVVILAIVIRLLFP